MFKLFDDNDNQLVKQCLNQNRKAQRLLYDRYNARLFALCRRYSADYDEAVDVLQESFIKIFSQLKQWQQGSLEGWMKKITVHTALDHYRKKQRTNSWMEALDDNTDISAACEALTKINTEAVLNAIAQLPEGYRMVFNLAEIEGYSHAEIAEMLGISVGTSKSQLSRAKSVLQNRLIQLEKKGSYEIGSN